MDGHVEVATSPTQATVPTAAAWSRVLKRLRTDLGEDVYISWFAHVEFQSANNDTVRLSVPTRFLKSWIHGNYRDKLLDFWRAEGYEIKCIDIVVRDATRPKVIIIPMATSEPIKRERLVPPLLPPVKPVTETPKRAFHEGPLGGSPTDPRLSFETFCEGAANRVALATARTIAERMVQSSFNPLYIHGGVGRGKSHLLHAIAQAVRAAHPEKNVVYLTVEHFMFRFVATIRNQSGAAFKESLREIDILLIDDIQFLQGKSSQQEFGHFLNILIDGARQVVVVADRPPNELELFDERVRSRLNGGMALEIGAPDLDLRRRILKSRLVAAREIAPALGIPDAIVDYVAKAVTTNGRDLEGAMNRLVAQWEFTKVPVTIESAEVTLRDLIGTKEPRRIRIEDIQRVVSRHFNVSKSDLLSSCRTRTIVRPRQIAMYLSKTMTPRSLPEIGRRFGGRDHTTVLHAVRKIEEMMAGDQAFAEEVELLRKMVEDQPIP